MPIASATPDPEVDIVGAAALWIEGNSSELVTEIAARVLGPSREESTSAIVKRALGLIDSVDIETQISDSTTWAFDVVLVGDGGYEVEVVGKSQVVVKVPLFGDTPLDILAVVVVFVGIDPIAVEDYGVRFVCVGTYEGCVELFLGSKD
ncbi:MAG: hypothetical protein OXI33_09010 [Chloroflexota bacterium]|nr:hypothetical protein [Chloroflexota bacterium]